MPSPALPGLFFCAAACVLLVFASVSAPTWNDISYMNVERGGETIKFGIFGWTGSDTQLGYRIPSSVLGYSDSRVNGRVMHNLTYTFILIPIAAGFAGLAVLFGLCGSAYSRIGTVFMSLAAALATVITLVAWVLEMVYFGITRNRINRYAPGDTEATFGNANWLVLGAMVSLFLGFCTGVFGICGRYRRTTERV